MVGTGVNFFLQLVRLKKASVPANNMEEKI